MKRYFNDVDRYGEPISYEDEYGNWVKYEDVKDLEIALSEAQALYVECKSKLDKMENALKQIKSKLHVSLELMSAAHDEDNSQKAHDNCMTHARRIITEDIIPNLLRVE